MTKTFDPIAEFRKPEALRLNSRRLEHLATLGLDLHHKTILEVGAGIGELTHFWLDRGATITSLEPRADNATVYRERYASEPRASLLQADLDQPPQHDTNYDIVFAYGVLYHLANPEPAIRWLADHCTGQLILSTCISLGDDDRCDTAPEYANCPSQAVSGSGCRPTRLWVLNRLREAFPHAYATRTQPNHDDFPLDWSHADPSHLTRAVFIASRTSLDDKPNLTSNLLPVQTPCP
ncbi:class I SAM-dependent methyltransferase [Mucisphaera sp.]|uniref:class I SAM-dependent methyltransferase n=1 Tax=Mucisphaera sp. TaxID=2913024 RepID=UPI003D0BB239